MTNKISVTRALAKVKHLDQQISKEINSIVPIRVVRGEGENKAFVGALGSIEEFEKGANSSIQSINDMMKYRDALKTAINKSNVLTQVKIVDKIMTVAEAIEAKSQAVVKRSLIAVLTNQYNKAYTVYEKERVAFEQKEESTLAAYGSRDKAPKEEELNIILKPLRDKQKPSLSDPLEIAKLIQALSKELDEFDLEVDFALSESNASTLIEA